MRYLIVLLGLLPLHASAQRWRVQLSGGLVTSVNLTFKRVQYANNFSWDGAGHFGARDYSAGLSLMRCDTNYEYGIGVQMLPVHFKDVKNINNGNYSHQTYIADPAYPITAIYNYGQYRKKGYVFGGVNAGIVVSSGRVTENFSDINLLSDLTIYYTGGFGYTIGMQMGYRRHVDRFDFGIQFMANYMRLTVRHGTSPEQHSFSLAYLPMQLYLGYRL